MPRASTRPEIVLALSITGAARALGLRYERIADAIDAGELVALQHPGSGKLRVPVWGERGLQAFVESWPAAKRKVPRHG